MIIRQPARSKFRQWMEMNPGIVTIVAVAVLVAAIFAIAMQLKPKPPRTPRDVYYYDLNTGTLFTDKPSEIPPIPAPSGFLQLVEVPPETPAGVRAHIYACGDCPGNLEGMSKAEVEQTNAYVAYLETYTPDVKSKMEEQRLNRQGPMFMPEMNMDIFAMQRDGHLIQDPNDPSNAWVPFMSPDGQAVVDNARQRCGEQQKVNPCLPPKS